MLLVSGYPQHQIDTLVKGFTEGFDIGYLGDRNNTLESNNLKSCLNSEEIVENKLTKEINKGRISEGYVSPPYCNFVCSPIGLVPKKVEGEFRLIHHLSYPKGTSVNDGIPDYLSTVSYATVDTAIKEIKKLGKGAFIAKSDIESAFRLLPVRKQDYHLLGFKWKDRYYYEKALPMGCSSSCRLFESFSSALEHLVKYFARSDKVVHVLDDFLFIGEDRDDCEYLLKTFLDISSQLGVPIAKDKTFGPASLLTFLGIELDCLAQEARLPQDKLNKCEALLLSFLSRKKVTLKEMLSLIGFLSFCCNVVIPGRPFTRRLIDKTKGIKQMHHRIKLSKECKLDMGLWLDFLKQFNGRSFFLNDNWDSSETLQLYTDAAKGLGFGAIFKTHWFNGAWPEKWKTYNIVILELFPIVLAVEIWGILWKNKQIVINTDNEALVHILNKQTSPDKLIMVLVRRLVLKLLQFNINFRARHIAGVKNVLADALSRLQVQKFRELLPQAELHPEKIPPLPPSLA